MTPGAAVPGAAAARFGDLSNGQCAGRSGLGEISLAWPRARMSREQALVHAAWLVLLADDDGEFPMVLDAVRSQL